MYKDIEVFNIREFLPEHVEEPLGEDNLSKILSDFSCEKNTDVQSFLKKQAVEFTKKNQSVTYFKKSTLRSVALWGRHVCIGISNSVMHTFLICKKKN